MAFENTGLEAGFLVASTNLASAQYFAVYQTTVDLQVNLCTSSTYGCLGILQNKPSSGQAADVKYAGFSKAAVGVGGWTPGITLQVSTAGDFVQWSSGVKVGRSVVTVSSGALGSMLLFAIPSTGPA